MLKIKKIDRLIYGGFIGPYLLSFFVAEFVLIMQFLWKFIDKILGKGISFFQIMELLFYMAVKLIPMAIPLTILISSVMVFGNMSEKYELSSIKSAGVSLLRTMRPGLYIAIGTALFSLLCSNFLVPIANFEFQNRFNRIKKTKPTLSFEEGIFSDDFRGFSIRIGKKHSDGRNIEDIIIEDNTSDDKTLVNVTIANHGEMYTTSDGNYFLMKLKDGQQSKELRKKKKGESKSYPVMRTQFEEWTKVFDMSGFAFNDNLSDLNRNKYDLLNSIQLLSSIDSLNRKIERRLETSHLFSTNKKIKEPKAIDKGMEDKGMEEKEEPKPQSDKKPVVGSAISNSKAYKENIEKLKSETKKQNDTKNNKKNTKRRTNKSRIGQIDSLATMSSYSSILETIKPDQKAKLLRMVKPKLTNHKDRVIRNNNSVNSIKKSIGKHIYKLNESYSWALVCIIFLFIGAPLGSIIRKGGYGYPLLFAIVFYMIFMITVIFGQKLLKTSSINPVLAAWLPCMLLIPIAIFLSYKALNDSKINTIGKITAFFNRWGSKN